VCLVAAQLVVWRVVGVMGMEDKEARVEAMAMEGEEMAEVAAVEALTVVCWAEGVMEVEDKEEIEVAMVKAGE
ncbi:MAG: hypothetical protein SGPRY_007277, partial [Prymnesium sp.]